jgi:hypothetical protein
MQNKDNSKFVKILPKSNPMQKVRNPSIRKSLSPVRENKKRIPDYLTHAQNKTYNFDIHASIENKKLEDLESFFVEKFKKVSKKMQETGKSTNSDSLNEKKPEKHEILETGSEEQPIYMSRMRKDLLQTELEVNQELDLEELQGKSKETSPVIEFKKKKQDFSIPYSQKFIILNKRTSKFFSSFESQGRRDLSQQPSSSTLLKEPIKLPVIRRPKFYDPTPMPSDFQLSKDMILPEY